MNHHDVIIAGGGPAGSTAAALLAQYGYRVLLLEQGQHPRFHVGESMMPHIDPIMQRLGIDWGAENLKKSGADFIHEASGEKLSFSLQGHFKTYQIDRSVFDHRLFKHAIQLGSEAHQLEKVLRVKTTTENVQIETNKAHYQTRYFIDATGRSTLMGRKKQAIKRLENLGRYAIYQYYQLKDNPSVEELFATGNVVILLIDNGWLWTIPMTGKRLSVGLVIQNPSETILKGEALFNHYKNASPFVSRLLYQSKPIIDIQVEAEFSYINQHRYGLRYACCGDAAGFLDPIFSSGFFFAVKTAELLVDRLHQGFSDNREADPELHKVDEVIYKTAYNTMYQLIERFYRTNMVKNLIFEFDRHARIKQEITALLAGDLWNDENLFQKGLLNGRGKQIL